MKEVKQYVEKHPKLNHPLHVHPHHFGCPTANLVMEIGKQSKGIKSQDAEKKVEGLKGKND